MGIIHILFYSASDENTLEIKPLTAIHTDTNSTVVTTANPVSFHKALLSNASDGNVHDLKSFLSRPVVIYSGNWTTSQVRNTGIALLSLPDSYFGSIPMIHQKLSGFLAIRAKFVIRLQVNATRFQQGRLILNFFPQNANFPAKFRMMLDSPMNYTQLPRVDLDAATDSEVILEIPYISPYLGYNSTDGTGLMGSVNLIVYDPLVSVSSELNAEVTLWAHMEDVELMYPTISNPTFVPQSGGRMRRRVAVGSRQIHDEEESVHTGPISSALSLVSSVSSLAARVPAISSFATTTSWATGIMANTASAFGLSKPLNQDKAIIVQQKPFIGAPNSDYSDNSHNLAIQASNSIEHLPGFAGNDKDEMSFQHTLSIPTWYNTYTWADSQVPLNEVIRIQIAPSVFHTTFLVGTLVSQYNTPMSFIGSRFQYYRGSIGFKFKFVKTEFHSGRLQFCFIPGYTSATAPVLTDANSAFIHKEVVDLRYTTESTFICPWASTVPFLPLENPYGTLIVNVLNELRHPDTVSTSINILVEVFCADDFEFAVPLNTETGAFIHDPSVSPSLAPAAPPVLEAQVGETEPAAIETDSVPNPLDQPIGSSRLEFDSLASSRFCVGESIQSIRQLLKRHNPWIMPNGSGLTSYVINPWRLSTGFNSGALGILIDITPFNTVLNASNTQQDYLSFFAPCYAYMRGSMRLKCYNFANAGANVKFSLLRGLAPASVPYRGGTYSSMNSDYPNSQHAAPIIQNSAVYPCAEVQVPYYNNFHMTYTMSGSGSVVDTAETFPPMGVRMSGDNSDEFTNFIVTRSVGEDFSLGFWTGALATTHFLSQQPFGPVNV